MNDKYMCRGQADGIFYYGGLLVDTHNHHHIVWAESGGETDSYYDERVEIDLVSNFVVEVNLDTVGRYTGQKDKHGKRVFEGDILKSSEYYDRPFTVKFGEHKKHMGIVCGETDYPYGDVQLCRNPQKG